jgi:hypothetical protein
MRTLFGILIQIVFYSSLNAQTINNSLTNFRYKKITEGFSAQHKQDLSDIEGTPYLEKEFNPGKIVTTDGTTFENIPVRYNACTDDLEFIQSDETFVIAPKSIVKRAEFGGVIFRSATFSSGGKIQAGLFKILVEGKATLLVKYNTRFFEKEEAKGYAGPRPARFDPVSKEFFIEFEDKIAKLIPAKKKLIDMFGEKKDEMEDYISQNKFSVKEEDFLIKIVSHYNSL